MIGRILAEAIGERTRERERKRKEKEKRKRRSSKYGQAKLRHAKRGVLSCLLACCILFFLVLIFSVSYIKRGEIDASIGFVGLMALSFSIIGFIKGIQGFKEREKNYISCKIGVTANSLFFIGLTAIFVRGFF